MSRPPKPLYPKIDPSCSSQPAAIFPDPNYTGSSVPIESKPHHSFRTKRKHVLKACERCRVKKSKCDGNQPCTRCLSYNQACIFRDKKTSQDKIYSRGFVEMLLSQHAIHLVALQELYRRCVNGEGFPGSPLEVSPHGQPGTHAILDRLGLIKQAEMAIEDPHRILQEINEYVKSLETACVDCADSSESTEQNELITSQSEDPSPDPSTPSEPAQSSDSPAPPRSNGSWPIPPATAYSPVYGAGIDVQALQQQQQQPNLIPSLNQVSFDGGFQCPHLIDGAHVYSPRYQFDDVACRKTENSPDYTWTVPYQDSAGFVQGQGSAHDGRIPFAASHVLPVRNAFHTTGTGSQDR